MYSFTVIMLYFSSSQSWSWCRLVMMLQLAVLRFALVLLTDISATICNWPSVCWGSEAYLWVYYWYYCIVRCMH